MDNEIQSKRQILVVDDEPDICKTISRYLSREGFEVHTAGDGKAMFRSMAGTTMDLVILDLRLPGKDGLTLARELRKTSDIPIIMLTAKDDVIDRVVGLESGADDYVAKPFHPRELLARIRAILRRAAPLSLPGDQKGSCLFSFAGWSLNAESRQLFTQKGKETPLSPVEFDLLYLFLQHPNRVLSRDFLLNRTRGRAAIPFDRAIDVHISHLRKKLEPNPQNPKVIRTIRSAGYIFVPTVTRQHLPKEG